MDATKQAEYKKKSIVFWKNYFEEYLEDRMDEQVALNIGFWNKLQTALESESLDVIYAVMLAPPEIHITESSQHVRIVRIAKRVWDKKRRKEE